MFYCLFLLYIYMYILRSFTCIKPPWPRIKYVKKIGPGISEKSLQVEGRTYNVLTSGQTWLILRFPSGKNRWWMMN